MAQCSRHGTVQPRRCSTQDRSSLRAQTVGVPSGRVPTTHILKPPTGEWDGHAENEHFSLLLARAAGLIVPNSGVQHFGGEIAIVVERILPRLRQRAVADARPPTGKRNDLS